MHLSEDRWRAQQNLEAESRSWWRLTKKQQFLENVYQTPKMFILDHILNHCLKKEKMGDKHNELTKALGREKRMVTTKQSQLIEEDSGRNTF